MTRVASCCSAPTFSVCAQETQDKTLDCCYFADHALFQNILPCNVEMEQGRHGIFRPVPTVFGPFIINVE